MQAQEEHQSMLGCHRWALCWREGRKEVLWGVGLLACILTGEEWASPGKGRDSKTYRADSWYDALHI